MSTQAAGALRRLRADRARLSAAVAAITAHPVPNSGTGVGVNCSCRSSEPPDSPIANVPKKEFWNPPVPFVAEVLTWNLSAEKLVIPPVVWTSVQMKLWVGSKFRAAPFVSGAIDASVHKLTLNGSALVALTSRVAALSTSYP